MHLLKTLTDLKRTWTENNPFTLYARFIHKQQKGKPVERCSPLAVLRSNIRITKSCQFLLLSSNILLLLIFLLWNSHWDIFSFWFGYISTKSWWYTYNIAIVYILLTCISTVSHWTDFRLAAASLVLLLLSLALSLSLLLFCFFPLCFRGSC